MAAALPIRGADAIGGSAVARLKRAGHGVTCVDVVCEHGVAIRGPSHGLRIAGWAGCFGGSAAA